MLEDEDEVYVVSYKYELSKSDPTQIKKPEILHYNKKTG